VSDNNYIFRKRIRIHDFITLFGNCVHDNPCGDDMGLRGLFKKRPTPPPTEGPQRASEKYKGPREIILPPRDEHGRFVPDRSRMCKAGSDTQQSESRK
jgi:hypothetical protein